MRIKGNLYEVSKGILGKIKFGNIEYYMQFSIVDITDVLDKNGIIID